MHIISLFSALLVLVPFAQSQILSDCHPFPGAVAQDCLELIGNNLNKDDELDVPCRESGRATITLRSCSITTVNVNCLGGTTKVSVDEVVRRALTTIGKCAQSDRGSISGFYIAEDTKTCYLYPGR
jgi:hypothetical protein